MVFRCFGKPPPDAQAVLPEAHESLISPETVAEVPLTGLSVGRGRLSIAGEEAAIEPHDHFGIPAGLTAAGRMMLCGEQLS